MSQPQTNKQIQTTNTKTTYQESLNKANQSHTPKHHQPTVIQQPTIQAMFNPTNKQKIKLSNSKHKQ